MKSNDKLTQDTLSEYDIISFDVFDTLLLRNVLRPTDIFKIVELEYNRKNSRKIDFYKYRIKAEEFARKNTREEDVLLKDIYRNIEQKLGSEKAYELQELEIEMERKFLIANEEIKEIFELAKSLNKLVYIITDMYLPKEIMDDLLTKNGINGYNRLFISGECKVTKATGSMYAYIREQERLGDKKWLHIGDNYQSDVLNAQNNNLHAYHYKQRVDRGRNLHVKTIGDSIVSAVQINHSYRLKNKDYWFQFGFEIIAPIFTGLTLWLAKQLKDKDNIYFFSRDGYLPYKLYTLLKKYDPELPEARYLLASRRAYIYPYLLLVSQKEAMDVLLAYNAGLNQKLTLQEVLENIGLESSMYQDQLKRFGMTSLQEVVNEENSNRVRQFLISIWQDIQHTLKKEYHSLFEYFRTQAIDQYERINIFDIGWRGSTQAAFQKLIGKPVYGYYFGIAEDAYAEIRPNTKGYAFDKGNPYTRRNFILENIMMFELIFSAPEGSLINFSYSETNGEIIPNIMNVEKNGELYGIIRTFQQGIGDFFQHIMPYYEYASTLSKDFVLSRFKTFIYSYKVNDMLQFKKLSNVVGFGNSYDMKKYVLSYDLDDYLSNRKKYDQLSRYNLWKHAILIQDDQGRYFSRNEIKRLYRLRSGLPDIHYKKYFRLLKKAIKNPRKATLKIINKLQILFRN